MCRRFVGLAVCLCLWSCEFDFTDPGRDTPATLTVQLTANAESDTLGMYAAIHPGRDADGRLRLVQSDLKVFGQSLAPTSNNADHTRAYQARWSLSSQLSTTASVPFIAPEVADVSTGPHNFEISIPKRIGPAAISVSNSESVVLPILYSGIPSARAQWRLEMFDSVSALRVNISSVGHPPDRITVPRSWFPSVSPARYSIRLDLSQFPTTEFVPGKYRFLLALHSQIRWTVLLEP
ncbi:MAG: hypothetical protein WEE89_18215 [Gemmatimonadota bacterium]